MSDGCNPTPPTDAGGSLPGGVPTTPCPCPNMEIEVNNTSATNDDLVQLQCTHPARRHNVSCRIRAQGGGTGNATIVLTNPDGRLRFPNSGDTTKTVTVPRSGSWVAFEISGETASNALNDAVIEAHCNTATGALKGRKTVTVFWFDQARIDIATPGTYRLVGNTLQSTGGNAANYSAQARIRPAGVDCSVPQVTDLRIGIMQNDVTSGLYGIARRLPGTLASPMAPSLGQCRPQSLFKPVCPLLLTIAKPPWRPFTTNRVKQGPSTATL